MEADDKNMTGEIFSESEPVLGGNDKQSLPPKKIQKKTIIIIAAILAFIGICLALFFITRMDIFLTIMVVVLFMMFPALVIFLCTKIKFLSKLGVVLLCYISGMIIGNIGILPASFTAGAQGLIQDISVSLALPLLLFSLNVKKWIKMAKSGMLSMFLALIAIVVVTAALFLIFGINEKGAQLSGLAAGVYTGGTPNIAAIYKSIGVTVNDYILFNTYDTVLSMLYIVILVTVARPFFLKLYKMRAFKSNIINTSEKLDENIFDESIKAYSDMFGKKTIFRLLGCFLISAGLLGVSYVIGGFCGDYATAVTILLITSGGIGLSFVKPVRETKKTFQLGMYIIYLFCFTVATMADFKALINIDWIIFAYVGLSIFGSLLLHALLCKFAKIDVDTMIIVSTSAVCSPPFVPVVANGLKNREILVTGLITGIVGYAIGNYVGIGIYYLYSSFI